MYVDIFYPVYVPNTFTPNNDGINDVFQVEGENLRGFWMAVYNRWGERVFYSDDPATPWLGNVAGGDHFAPDGMYLWQVRVELAGGPILLEGHVHLLR